MPAFNTFDVNPILRLITGLILVLILPGYTLTSCLFPKAHDLEPINRIALTFGFSTVVVALIGYALNFADWEINRSSMGICIGSVVLVFALLGIYQRSRLNLQSQSVLLSPLRHVLRNGLLALLFLGITGAVILSATAQTSQKYFTEFYVLGTAGLMESYPSSLVPGEPFTITLGIKNYESDVSFYRVEGSIGADKTVLAHPTLQIGEDWEQHFQLTAPNTLGQREVIFELYKDQSNEPYRTLRLTITVGS